jgi:hypothetical protein
MTVERTNRSRGAPFLLLSLLELELLADAAAVILMVQNMLCLEIFDADNLKIWRSIPKAKLVSDTIFKKIPDSVPARA